MKLLLSGALVVAALGVLPLMGFVRESGPAHVPAIEEAKKAPSGYRLSVTGRESTCVVAKGETLDAARSILEFTEDCVALMPRLAEARYWKESADGEVVFAADDGRVIAQFYAADGVAYESVRPVSPLMLLTLQ